MFRRTGPQDSGSCPRRSDRSSPQERPQGRAAFDAGWTHAGDYDKDPTRFGKSVRRKVVGGKLADTNVSTNDFTPNATPSLKK